MPETSYAPKVYRKQGGAEEVIAAGGKLTMEAGGGLADIFAGSGQKRLAWGQAVTASAVDTIVTGLGTLIAVLVSFDSDPGDNPEYVSGSIGDQAGTPAAGSFLLKTWQNTSGTDPTPTAATTFSKKINWLAIGA